MAYAYLGLSYSADGESVLSAQSTTKAWQLRDRVSDREQFFIDFTYDRQVTGNLEKAYQTLELWLQTYPRGEQPSALGLLAGLSTHGTGRLERAIEASQKTDRGGSRSRAVGYANLASSYFLTGSFRGGRAHASTRLRTQAGDPDFLVLRYNIAMLKGDSDQMDRAAALAKGKPRAEHSVAHVEALALARSGQLRRPGRSSSRAVELALQEGEREGRRVTRPHERCGKRLAGMVPKRRRTPWRRWRFRTDGTSNTLPALPWRCREIRLDRNRSPMISKRASRKIPSRNLLTCQCCAPCQRLADGKPTRAWNGCISLFHMSWR